MRFGICLYNKHTDKHMRYIAFMPEHIELLGQKPRKTKKTEQKIEKDKVRSDKRTRNLSHLEGKKLSQLNKPCDATFILVSLVCSQ